MADSQPQAPPSAVERSPADRLDSWKEIAAYMKRDVTTVQRWEKREGMPVHRHLHDKLGSVYAFRGELDSWARSRRLAVGSLDGARAQAPAEGEGDAREPAEAGAALEDAGETPMPRPARFERLRRRPGLWALAATGAILMGVLATRALLRRAPAWENPLAAARFVQLTDFDGIEQAAAISRDGRFVAFQSDRHGRMDVWVTQVGTGQFLNLTRGAAPEIVNPSIRTLGFSPEGTLVTFWARGPAAGGRPDIGIWAAPLLGGAPRPYLEGAAEFDWSGDGARLVFHTPGPGDPMFVRDPDQGVEARRIFSAPEGLHGHFLLWSPDREFVWFVQGTLPDRLDLWRIRRTGGAPERITFHGALVSHPVFLDARTLLYLATDPDGSGPWIHALDVGSRASRRVSFGVERYTSLAASADGRRIVATQASPKVTFWRVPMIDARVDMTAARRIPLTTGTGSSPRLGPGYLLYVRSNGGSDGVWKLQEGVTTELWSAPGARILGAPAIGRDGRRIAFSSRRQGRTALQVMNADGTDARAIARDLEVQGAPAWRPDGEALTVSAVVDGMPRLFDVPLDGSSPTPLVAEHAVDPAWAPDGDIVAFSGADVGTTFPVKVVRADGRAPPVRALTLTRGSRHLFFMPRGRSLVVLRGEIGHKNLWRLDLETGAEHPITDLPPGFEVRDFDISPDGSELVLQRVQEHSDLVLVERARR